MTASRDSKVPLKTPPSAAARPESNGAAFDDEEDEWRHAPVAPNDANPLDSLGKAVSDVVTTPVDPTPPSPKPRS